MNVRRPTITLQAEVLGAQEEEEEEVTVSYDQYLASKAAKEPLGNWQAEQEREAAEATERSRQVCIPFFAFRANAYETGCVG